MLKGCGCKDELKYILESESLYLLIKNLVTFFFLYLNLFLFTLKLYFFLISYNITK